MLAARVIPCLDVESGRVVKGTNFVDLRDAGDPVEVAAGYEEQGADELVFLDITASHENRSIMLEVVKKTAEKVFMPLTVGGGIRTLDDIRALLQAGCDKVSINSAACRDPEFVRQAALRFGSQCIVVNIDPKRIIKDGKTVFEVHINGGRTPTGLEAVSWAKEVEALGAGEIVLNQYGLRRNERRFRFRDHQGGRGSGGGFRLLPAVVPVIRNIWRTQLLKARQTRRWQRAFFHFDEYTIEETKKLMAEQGIPVRL